MFNASNHRRTALPRLRLMPLLLLAACGAVLTAQGAWRDPSKHDVRFVTVGQDVQLEVLDWGGSGLPSSSSPVRATRAMCTTTLLRS